MITREQVISWRSRPLYTPRKLVNTGRRLCDYKKPNVRYLTDFESMETKEEQQRQSSNFFEAYDMKERTTSLLIFSLFPRTIKEAECRSGDNGLNKDQYS
jgi:hypothetical protein